MLLEGLLYFQISSWSRTRPLRGLIAFLVFGNGLQPLQVAGVAVIVAGIITAPAASNDAAIATAALK